jgi:hypothetical protein
LSEIFQWKGPLPDGLDQSFPQKDIIHIGEEIADVFIYSIRLCDICNVNLAKAVMYQLSQSSTSVESSDLDFICLETNLWSDLTFSILDKQLIDVGNRSRSPRDTILDIHTQLGEVSKTFRANEELSTKLGLTTWNSIDINKAAISLANISILLSWMAYICGLRLENCVRDKMAKNAAKYPVNLVKGKSAKYTAYQKLKFDELLHQGIQCAVCIFVGFMLRKIF